MSLWTRLRQNLSLKIISVVTAILLYIYVQQERNPTVQRSLLANVEYRNLQEGYQVVSETTRITVVVTGPRPTVEALKDGDIKASADLSSISGNQPGTPVRLSYELPKAAAGAVLDPVPEFIKVQVFRQKSRKLRVDAIFQHDSPAGLKYGDPVIHPSQVTVRGREDRVNRIDKVVAQSSPTEPRSSIDGDFSLVPWDSDNNVVEDITIVPSTVHVTVPQVQAPAEQSLLVNPMIADRPVPPYYVSSFVITPNQIKIIGTPTRLATITSIYTETLSVKDLTTTTTVDASLITPPDVQVRDMHGKPITKVKVTIVLSKTATPPVSDGSSGATPPKRDGPNGP